MQTSNEGCTFNGVWYDDCNTEPAMIIPAAVFLTIVLTIIVSLVKKK